MVGASVIDHHHMTCHCQTTVQHLRQRPLVVVCGYDYAVVYHGSLLSAEGDWGLPMARENLA